MYNPKKHHKGGTIRIIFNVSLDQQTFNEKPNGYNAAAITNRIAKYKTQLTAEELSGELISGKSFVPSTFKVINGKTQRDSVHWQSQQIFCIDFDNEIEIKDPNNSRKRIKVPDIRITIETALEEFKETAMFIYTSFSHSPEVPKLRVVFALDEAITDYGVAKELLLELHKRYPYMDKKCTDPTRLFFGGRDLYILNFKNRLQFESKNKQEWGFSNTDSIRVFKSKDMTVGKTPPSNHLDLINKKNILKLQELLQPVPIEYSTYAETLEYIKKLDLNQFLGISDRNFNCIFHDDISPSASIFPSKDTGDILYCCGSENCTFGTGSIIKCVERLTGLNRRQSIKFLRDVYMIKFEQTEWQKEQIENLEENIRYILSPEFEYSNPIQYKLVKRYIPDLVQYWTIVRDYIPPEHYSLDRSRILFFSSLTNFARLSNKKDTRQLVNRFALFTYLNYIKKLGQDEIPEKLFNESKKYLVKQKAKEKHSMSMIQYWEAYPLTDEILSEAEDKAQQYYDLNLSMTGWSWEMICRALGEEEANRIYPQYGQKNTRISERSHNMTSIIESVMMDMVNERGWATEKEVLQIIDDQLQTSKSNKHRQMKKIIGELLPKYGLTRVQLNRKLSKELGIPPLIGENGYEGWCKIIFK